MCPELDLDVAHVVTYVVVYNSILLGRRLPRYHIGEGEPKIVSYGSLHRPKIPLSLGDDADDRRRWKEQPKINLPLGKTIKQIQSSKHSTISNRLFGLLTCLCISVLVPAIPTTSYFEPPPELRLANHIKFNPIASRHCLYIITKFIPLYFSESRRIPHPRHLSQPTKTGRPPEPKENRKGKKSWSITNSPRPE